MRSLAVDFSEEAEGAGAVAGVVRLPQLEQGRLGLGLHLVQRGPGQVTGGQVGTLEGLGRPFNGAEVKLRHPILAAGWSHAENPAPIAVALLVAADARIIPVGHEERTVRGNGYVYRAEPVI